MLKIFKYESDQDWQRKGHFSNTGFCSHFCPTYALLPFSFTTKKSLTVSVFQIQQVKILEASTGVSVIESYDIDTSLLVQTELSFVDEWIYSANLKVLNLVDEGFYQMYVEFSDGSKFKSELIYIPCTAEISECLPDFNIDFNNDFNVCNPTYFNPIPYNYGYLYNFFAINSGKLAPDGWRVPTNADFNSFVTSLGGIATAGGRLKSTRIDPTDAQPRWDAPNTSATNDVGFEALPGGYRGSLGAFVTFGNNATFGSSTASSATSFFALQLFSFNAIANIGGAEKTFGVSIRVCRDATAAELLLADGTLVDDVTDIDGNLYNAVKIGSLCWTTQNLKVTKYNDGVDIPRIFLDSEWAALSTGAYSRYDNVILDTYEDESYYYTANE